ncbi:MAG: hypothetical protein WAK55_27580 [Xanthobacteraceae bacterium]
MSIDDNAAAKTGGPMRIFIFKSETSPELRAFGGDLAGTRLPIQFKPWHAVGSIAPEGEFPYKLSRELIETAINDCGYQLWRMRKKSKSS